MAGRGRPKAEGARVTGSGTRRLVDLDFDALGELVGTVLPTWARTQLEVAASRATIVFERDQVVTSSPYRTALAALAEIAGVECVADIIGVDDFEGITDIEGNPLAHSIMEPVAAEMMAVMRFLAHLAKPLEKPLTPRERLILDCVMVLEGVGVRYGKTDDQTGAGRLTRQQQFIVNVLEGSGFDLRSDGKGWAKLINKAVRDMEERQKSVHFANPH